MIRINLLSDREALRKEATRKMLSIYLLLVLLTVVVAGAVHFTLYQKKKGLEEDIQAVETRLRELKEKIEEVEKYKQFKAELLKKLEVIRDLQKNKILSVHLLDILSQKTPERMWLSKLAKKGTDMTLEGYAVDNETIAGFMKELEGTAIVSNVELRLTEDKDIQGLPLKHFLITASVTVPAAGTSAGAGAKQAGSASASAPPTSSPSPPASDHPGPAGTSSAAANDHSPRSGDQAP